MSFLSEYKKSARSSLLFYTIFGMGILFVFSSVVVDPEQNCVEYPCPVWLRALIGGLGILFASGALIAIWRGFEYGSRIDTTRRVLVWWEGIPPVQEHIILADEIKIIQIDLSADDSLELLDGKGQRILLSNSCIPFPHDKWVQSFQQAFPHIKVIEK